MADLRWTRVEEIYHAALEQPPGERDAFVREACASDSGLRIEVQSLLAHSGSDLEPPVWNHAAGSVASLLEPGSLLGPYRVTARIGAGGMGEVYKACDTRLNRTVALKVLSQHLQFDPARKARFEREVRAIASLNHPHICTAYDVGAQHGIAFLVMEYLDGQTLAERLEKGALSMGDVLRYSLDIADALSQAHTHGIVHRDLKPANIMLTRSGVKILDFGLSKVESADATNRDPSLTAQGAILGTLQYMAPEQLEGKDADARSDIFALGALMYEMATGRKAFSGSSQASLISAIMSVNPEPGSKVRPDLPPAFDYLIRICLEKDPAARWQSAHDVLLQLKLIVSNVAESRSALQTARGFSSRKWLALAGTVALLVIAAVVFILLSSRPISPQKAVRFTILAPDGFQISALDRPATSPDGRMLVFSAYRTGNAAAVVSDHTSLFLRSLDSVQAQPLRGTDGGYLPFWSPDSQSIGFFARGKLYRLDLAQGGSSRPLCDVVTTGAKTFGATWSSRGEIIFTDERDSIPHLQRVSAGGGEPMRIFERDPGAELWPEFLPDGQHFLFFSYNSKVPGQFGLQVGSLDSPEFHKVPSIDVPATFAPPGYLLFTRARTLFAQKFDTRTFRVSGEPSPISSSVSVAAPMTGRKEAIFEIANPWLSWSPFFITARSSVLVFFSAPAPDMRLSWYTRAGQSTRPVLARGPFQQITLSPDSKRVLIERLDPDIHTWDLWLLEISTGIFSRFTFDPANDTDAVWSPDSRRAIFASDRSGTVDLYLKTIGGGEEELLSATNERKKVPESWVGDDSILYTTRSGGTWYLLPLAGDRKPKMLSHEEFRKDEPHVSPDGRFIAYGSLESGQWEVYLARFPDMTEKRQLSINGGGQALWRGDGKELYFLSAQNVMMAVGVNDTGGRLDTGAPKPLFQTHAEMIPTLDQYGVTAEGKMFLVEEPVQHPVPSITVLVNWMSTAQLSLARRSRPLSAARNISLCR